jgi:hypothetical protein
MLPTVVSVTEAARRCGVDRRTIKRRLDAGCFPNAYRTDDKGIWVIPKSDLEAAGYKLSSWVWGPEAKPKRGTVRTVRSAYCSWCGGEADVRDESAHEHKVRTMRFASCHWCDTGICTTELGTWVHDGPFPFCDTYCYPR